MKHGKLLTTASVAVLVAVSAPAVAAELANGDGQSCGSAVGTWHFVNNQTDGTTTPGVLTATFTDGGVWTVTAYAVNKNTQHFLVESTGTLASASTNLPGRLVLSDFTCDGEVKK